MKAGFLATVNLDAATDSIWKSMNTYSFSLILQTGELTNDFQPLFQFLPKEDNVYAQLSLKTESIQYQS